jgi:RNA polymerase sigma-70 factor (ECF subfamily)
VTSAAEVEVALRDAFREQWGRVVATLIRATGDWDLAEECAQDAFTLALETWARDGVPRSPGAWLTTAARNRARDRQRRVAVGAAKLQEVAVLSSGGEPRDRTMKRTTVASPTTASACCSRAVTRPSRPAQVALTLRARRSHDARDRGVPGSGSDDGAAARLAKRKIRNRGSRTASRPRTCCPSGRSAVLAVIYLLFNEGYARPRVRTSSARLCEEAIRLARTLEHLMPDEPETAGLLALLLLQDARRDARVDEAGDLVPLDAQDRTRWDADAIAEGVARLDAALRRGEPGPYQVQAAIAACHATAATAAETDWHEIAGLYRELVRMVPTPIVELNRAVAVSMADGPGARPGARRRARRRRPATELPPAAATRADLLRRLGQATKLRSSTSRWRSRRARRNGGTAQRLAEVGRG